jgi:hypothetical protein
MILCILLQLDISHAFYAYLESCTTLRYVPVEQLYRDVMYDIQTSVQAFALLGNYCVEAYGGAIRM